MHRKNAFVDSLVVLLVLAIGGTVAADELPTSTPEGLQLLPDTKVYAAYVMPGATLDPYNKVALVDCYVAFRKNWERDYNRDERSLEMRVDARDMERIKTRLAEEFKRVFTDELSKGGYEVVDHTGEDVLVIRPALVNLDVNAPDLMTASRSRSYVASAGSMTLYMELYDSVSSDLIAKVIDPEESDHGGIGFEANRVTNTAEADRILRKWARLLRDHLGKVQAVTKKG